MVSSSALEGGVARPETTGQGGSDIEEARVTQLMNDETPFSSAIAKQSNSFMRCSGDENDRSGNGVTRIARSSARVGATDCSSASAGGCGEGSPLTSSSSGEGGALVSEGADVMGAVDGKESRPSSSEEDNSTGIFDR